MPAQAERILHLHAQKAPNIQIDIKAHSRRHYSRIHKNDMIPEDSVARLRPKYES